MQKRVNNQKSEVLTAHFFGLKKPEMTEKNWNRILVNKTTPKEIRHKTPQLRIFTATKSAKTT